MANLNTRPEYYQLCISFGSLIGCRVIDRELAGEPMSGISYPYGYPYRSYAAGEVRGPGEIHRGPHGDLKTIGRAYESALMRSGWRIVKGEMVPWKVSPRRYYNMRNTLKHRIILQGARQREARPALQGLGAKARYTGS
jgi:hypothetical protein